MKFYLSRILALALAEHLFELEVESLGNDTEDKFWWNGWIEKYGESSIEFESQLTSDKDNEFNAPAIEEIATWIQKHYAEGYWTATEENIKGNSFYQYMMPTTYQVEITEALEKQLAMLTKVGYQEELFA